MNRRTLTQEGPPSGQARADEGRTPSNIAEMKEEQKIGVGRARVWRKR